MPLTTSLIGVPLLVAFAFFGRWIQLHPEKVAPKGSFGGPNTFWARLFRAQVIFIGTGAVLGGTWCAVFGLLSALTSNLIVLGIGQVAGLGLGMYVAVRVRKEVRRRPAYVSTSPYGWWP